MSRYRAGMSWVAAASLWAVSAPAFAQVTTAAGRPVELAVGGSWSAPVGLGDAPVDLLASSGAAFTQFRTSSKLGQTLGFDVRVGIGLSRRVWAEGVGGWSRVPFQTDITDDFEDADDLTLTEIGSRFSVGGALRVILSERSRTSWFLRGGAAWMREVAGASTLVGDGLTADAGLGLTRVFRERPRGALRAIGIRLDGRVQFRSGGLALGPDEGSLRFGPAVGGALTMGFR